MNKKFIILCVIVAVVTVFLLIPINSEDYEPSETGKENLSREKETENLDENQAIEEWNPDEFSEDKKDEILGTFARKREGKTFFIYFDREGLLLYEIHDGDKTEKEIGRYKLRENELNIDGKFHEFDRNGDNIIIDGKEWEYLEGVILSFV